MKKKLILGSSSPRRIELIERLGLEFTSFSPDIEEVVEERLPPDELVKELALMKAKAVIKAKKASFKGDTVLLTADTVVVLDGEVIGKPKNKEEARKVLENLSSKTHHVYTGLCYVYQKASSSDLLFDKESVKTEVCFKKLDRREIESYILTDEPYDKAGAYAIQGNSSYMVKRIQGSYTNVMGLPLAEVSDKFKELEII